MECLVWACHNSPTGTWHQELGNISDHSCIGGVYSPAAFNTPCSQKSSIQHMGDCWWITNVTSIKGEFTYYFSHYDATKSDIWKMIFWHSWCSLAPHRGLGWGCSRPDEEDQPFCYQWSVKKIVLTLCFKHRWLSPCCDGYWATVLLHLHCLLFGVLGWVSVQHFEISADVRRAI